MLGFENYIESIEIFQNYIEQEERAKDTYVANAAGCLFALQRHIARRPTPGNAKHIGGARRLFVRWCTSLHCLRWLRRVPLSVNYVKGQSGPNRDLLYYLHTGYLSPTLRCTPSGLTRSLLPEQCPLRWLLELIRPNNGPMRRWHDNQMPEPQCALQQQSGGGCSWSERKQPGPARTLLATLAHCLILQYDSQIKLIDIHTIYTLHINTYVRIYIYIYISIYLHTSHSRTHRCIHTYIYVYVYI